MSQNKDKLYSVIVVSFNLKLICIPYEYMWHALHHEKYCVTFVLIIRLKLSMPKNDTLTLLRTFLEKNNTGILKSSQAIRNMALLRIYKMFPLN